MGGKIRCSCLATVNPEALEAMEESGSPQPEVIEETITVAPPILKQAELGIVADLFEVIPELAKLSTEDQGDPDN